MRILIACEESQTVCHSFRKLGFEAYSNDLQKCSGGGKKYHLQCDLFDIVNDGWDLMIAFPPCTHLAVSGAAHFARKRANGQQQEGIDFFMKIVNAPIPRIAIENPVGIMSTVYRKPDQIIQPYYFGDEAQKTTCLWLKGLPTLTHDVLSRVGGKAYQTDAIPCSTCHAARRDLLRPVCGKWHNALRLRIGRAAIRRN